MMCRDLYTVYASDDRFAEILGVSLTSLYENNRDMEQIVVYVLDSGISEENRARIEGISAAYERHPICWLEAKDISHELQMEVSIDRGSLSQYARLFVSSCLPQGLERVLYLDCDIIVEQSLLELWNLDMHGKTIAALNDAFSKWYRRNIDLELEDVMFNSGVMLIDLRQWEEQNVEKRLLKYIASKKGKIQQGDQGALNAVLSKDTYCFEPRFNSVTIYYDFSYEEMLTYRKPPMPFYSKEQIREAIEHPVMIHFTTSFLSKRPWMEGCEHRYVGEWMRYKALSPWTDAPLWPTTKRRRLQAVGVWLFHAAPRRLAVAVAGIMQAYMRPLLNRIKRK